MLSCLHRTPTELTRLVPSQNLNTLFEFVLKGFDALEYKEHLDYQVNYF